MFKKIRMALMPKVNNEALIVEIHNSFDSAGDILLKEAKDILAGNYDIEKGERLKKIGFTQSKKAIEATAIANTKESKQQLATLIEYYQVYYPNNKFITEEMVKSICEKYNLLCGNVSSYIGDVPVKNISEIENFKLRDEEMTERSNIEDYKDRYFRLRSLRGIAQLGSMIPSYSQSEYNPPKEIHSYLVKGEYKICAPKKDFDMRGMEVNGHKLEVHIPDPIVLQPVKGGYLIVSKWGLEGDDESLVNEISN